MSVYQIVSLVLDVVNTLVGIVAVIATLLKK